MKLHDSVYRESSVAVITNDSRAALIKTIERWLMIAKRQ